MLAIEIDVLAPVNHRRQVDAFLLIRQLNYRKCCCELITQDIRQVSGFRGSVELNLDIFMLDEMR